jgi:hypothetical protein
MIGRYVGMVEDDYHNIMGWAYVTIDHFEPIREITNWCNQNIDPLDWKIQAGATFYFKNQDDLMLFRLRWL